MAGVPVVNPNRIDIKETPVKTTSEIANADYCRRHCHYPVAGDRAGCICSQSRLDCDFEWDDTGRGFCRTCHHASSLTVKAADCTLEF